jgi:drug/metabolite transporter (DMT)-like permease
VASVLARTAAHLLSFFLHASVLYYSNEANINFSLVINLYSLTPFFTALLFFCFFNEAVNRSHMLGMFFIFSCIYITSQSTSSGQEGQTSQDPGNSDPKQ